MRTTMILICATAFVGVVAHPREGQTQQVVLPATGAQPAEPPRSSELRRIDAILQRLEKLQKTNPKSRDGLAEADKIAPTVEAIVNRDIESGTRDSGPWTGYDGKLALLRNVWEAAGRTADELKWRDLWLLSSASAGLPPAGFDAAIWYYMLLVDAKYRSPQVYEKALQLAKRVYDRQQAGETVCSQSLYAMICDLQLGSQILKLTGATQAALDLEHDALLRLRADRSLSGITVLRATLEAAFHELEVGSAVLGTQLLESAEQFARDAKQQTMPATVRFALATLQAEAARMRLDDRAAADHYRYAADARAAAVSERTGNTFEDKLLDLASVVFGNIPQRLADVRNCAPCDEIRSISSSAKPSGLSLDEPKPPRDAKAAATMVEESHEQFGDSLGALNFLGTQARRFRAMGAARDERATVALLVKKLKALQSSNSAIGTDAAHIVVPALVRAAQLERASGASASARALLDWMDEIVRSKLTREWRSGNERAAGALRDLQPAVQSGLDLRIAIAAAEREPQRAMHYEAIFRAFQLVMLGETAATLQAATMRRLSVVPGLKAALDRRSEISARVDRLDGIAKGFSTDFVKPVGVQRELASKRDVLKLASAEVDRLWPADPLAATLEPVTLAAARAVLRPDEAILFLHPQRASVLGFLLQPGGNARAWSTAISEADLQAQVARIRSGVDIMKGFLPFPAATASRLFERLLGPVRKELGGIRHVVLLSDGALQSLPLGILPTSPVNNDAMDLGSIVGTDIKWLALSHAVSYVPSVRSIVDQRRSTGGSKAPLAFLGVGDPRLGDSQKGDRAADFSQVYSSSELADVDKLRRMGSLPETADELKAIARTFGTRGEDLLLGEAATERRVKSLPLKQYKVVSFATHGLMAGVASAGAEPGLVLTPPQVASREDDGLLTSGEIMSLELDADLVMLSACDTASSDGRPRAEGFSGLTRAFLAAGARSLIVTHWKIPSEPAVEVTTSTVRAWQQNGKLNWAEALQQAQRALIRRTDVAEYAHPASWGAFQVVGSATR